MSPREDEFSKALFDLVMRYRDLHGPARWFHLMLAGLAIVDGAKNELHSTTEEEWIALCRSVFRRVRSTASKTVGTALLFGCSSGFSAGSFDAGSSDAQVDAREASSSATARGFGGAPQVLGAGGVSTVRPLCDPDASSAPCAKFCQNLVPCCDSDTGRCGCTVGIHCVP